MLAALTVLRQRWPAAALDTAGAETAVAPFLRDCLRGGKMGRAVPAPVDLVDAGSWSAARASGAPHTLDLSFAKRLPMGRRGCIAHGSHHIDGNQGFVAQDAPAVVPIPEEGSRQGLLLRG
jgi:hypothetical protein